MGHRMKGQKRLGSGLGDACKGLVEEGWEKQGQGAERAGRHQRACPGGWDPGAGEDGQAEHIALATCLLLSFQSSRSRARVGLGMVECPHQPFPTLSLDPE